MNKTSKYFKVGIYLRLSTEDKNKKNQNIDSESIKNQRNMLIDYIEKHPQFILIDEYCDEDLSGAGTFRPEFERLIKDCKNKKLDIVLCKSQSRFSRDMEIIEKYINNKFKEWNIRFISITDNADTKNYGNKKSRQINGLVNEWYLEDISNNIRSALKSKMIQGEYISPFASFGYQISKSNNNKLIIDPQAATIVKQIYNLYLKGLGFTNIAKYLNNKNIPSPSLYKYQNNIKLNIISNKPREKIKWNPSAIKNILTNELYLGHLIQGKRTTVSYKNHKIIKKERKEWIRKENTHEAIIDKNTFNKVQNIIKERTKSPTNTNVIHIFSKKVFCNECHCYMKKKNSSKHEYLVCSNTQINYHTCSNKSSIRYDYLETIILDYFNQIIEKYYDHKTIESEYLQNIQNKFTNKIIILEKQKKQIETKISHTNNYLKNLYEDKINNIITQEQFKYLMDNYNQDEKDLKTKLQTINSKINLTKLEKKNIKNYKHSLKKYQQLTKLNKVIIDEFVDKIYIDNLNKSTNTRNIKIKWNFN